MTALALMGSACSSESKKLSSVLCEAGYQPKSDSDECEQIPHAKCDDGWLLREDAQHGHYCVRKEDFEKRTVHGVIYANDTGKPLQGAEVYVLGMQDTPVTTDDRGYYKIEAVAPKGNAVLYVKKAGYNYYWDTIELGDVGMSEQGGYLYEYDLTLYREPEATMVRGTVYAGDVPANGAQVQLYDNYSGRLSYSVTTGADGRFTFPTVTDGYYALRVAPLDANGDGIFDFRFSSTNLPNPLSGNTSSTTNVTNLVVSLEPYTRNVLYSNLYDGSNNRLKNFGATNQSNLRLASPSSKIVLHFSDRMITDSLQAELWSVETNVNPKRFVKQLTLTKAWSNGDSVLTIDPGNQLLADADASTQYTIRVRSLQWADGTWFIHPTTGISAPWELTFDVADLPDYLPIPTPQVYLTNDEGAATATFDAQMCWLRNASEGRVTEWNTSTGFTLGWQHVPGAKGYAIYARQLNGFARDQANVGWRRVVDNVAPASGTIDPNLNTTIWTTGVLRNWMNFGFSQDLLAYGNKVQFAVVPKDAVGYEAVIDPAKALEIKDTQKGGLDSSYNSSYDWMGSSATELELTVQFTEYMATATAPQIASVSSALGLRDSTIQTSWGSNPADENASNSARFKMVIDQPGSCARVETDVIYRSLDPSRSDKALVVSDTGLFQANGEAFFAPVGMPGSSTATLTAGNLGERVEIDSVDATTGVVTLRNPIKETVGANGWNYLCTYSGMPTLASSSTTNSLTIRVSSADKFMPGQWILLRDPTVSSQAAYLRHVVNVRTADKELDLNDYIPVSLNAGTTRVMFMPTAVSQQGLRPVQKPVYGGFTTTVAGDNTLTFNAYELNYTLVAKGDRILVDADGDMHTMNDQSFAMVTGIRVKEDEAANPRRDELTVSGLPAGLSLVKDRTVVILLGDELRISNAAQLKDTSGNTGLFSQRDEISFCASSWYDYEGNRICSGGTLFVH